MTHESLSDLNPDSVGKLLKEARETQGISLDDVAHTLCINKRTLLKLESDDESLMCDVYNIGFLRSYAKLLNLNDTALVQQFKNQNISLIEPVASEPTFCVPSSKWGKPSLGILVFSFLILVGVIVGYEWFRDYTPLPSPQAATSLVLPPLPEVKKDEAPDIIPQNIDALAQPTMQPAIQMESAPESESSPLPVETADPQAILLKITEESWIEVKDDKGQTVVSRLFYPDETYEFKNPENFLLKTGNARGIHLICGEKKLTFPGNKGEVKSEIPLDPAKWID